MAEPNPDLLAMATLQAEELLTILHGESQQVRPRVFWRGEAPGAARVAIGHEEWDSYLFLTDNPVAAAIYGGHVTRYEAAPDARILYEGTPDFGAVAGARARRESLTDYAIRADVAARVAGYDAIWFRRQADLGTVVFHRSKFSKARQN